MNEQLKQYRDSLIMNRMDKTLAGLSKEWLKETWGYRPSAFWFWNADMKPETMADIVAEMAKNKIREFLIHPNHGLEIEYLSDEYFDRCRLALSLARGNNLKVWIYDEFAWPSGIVGGQLVREHPEHKGWYLAFYRNNNGEVTIRPEQSDRVLDCVTGAPWTQSDKGYLDTLSAPAVRCFIEMTHERYYRECGDYFDDVICGFFTDEPAAMMNRFENQNNLWLAIGVPWTPTLPSEFKARFGYEIEPLYGKLAESGPSEVKRDYWQLVKKMHADAYHGQIGQWCRQHGVKYTGHVGEDNPLQEVRFAGSIYQSLGQMDEPGIDYLGGGCEPDQRFVENMVVTSLARHHGCSRVFCEAFGVSPFTLRLGEMLRRAQMMGLYGVNDIALMGFHHSLHGFRKRAYWPPIFRESSWWSFYPEFRDAFARSVGIISSGRRYVRYAILYPQNALEETDPFYNKLWGWEDLGCKMIDRLGRAVYAAGENFEFVFPEMLSEGKVIEGKIVFPFAEYEAILAPNEVPFFEESIKTLERLEKEGGRIYRQSIDDMAEVLKKDQPSWSMLAKIHADYQNVRIYRFDYPDGELFVLRNVSDVSQEATFRSQWNMAAWEPADGTIFEIQGTKSGTIPAHSGWYITVSKNKVTTAPLKSEGSTVSMFGEWHIETQKPNLMRFSTMQFRHEAHGWIKAEEISHGNMIPSDFFGYTTIPMRASFECQLLPESLGFLFEREHLASLAVNGQPIDISKSKPMMIWDASCKFVDIRNFVHIGKNEVTAELAFPKYETSLVNEGFFSNKPMPGCDVCLAGAFRVIDRAIVAPIDLSTAGWRNYHGIIKISGRVEIDQLLADKIKAIQLNLISEEAAEVELDGISLGRRISPTYDFNVREKLVAGSHKLTIRLAGTNANLFDKPVAWGIESVQWIV
jgi:hypothetical protein